MRLGSLSQKCFESNTKCGRCDKKGRCNIAAPFGTGGRFGMAAAYRVAAPSIRIVPWAALASCWPLPQQFLPVSATGGGRRCCTLAMFTGMDIFICSSETPAGVSELLFHGRSHSGERHLPQKPVNRFKVRTNSRHAKKGLLRGAAAPEGQVIAAQTSKLGSSFSMWILDIKALCSGSVNSASFTYLFSTAAVRTGSAMVPAPPMQPPGQPMPSSR